MAYANFNIIDWHAISAGIESKDAWRQWQGNNFTWPQGEKASVDKIPAMARRRMSSLSKLAVQTALTLAQDQQVDYLIFASRHGELTRTCALLEDILKGEDASPIAFSQSVHNTAAGLFTITAKKAIPVTSIVAGENTFHSALIEAAAYLSDNSNDKVLVIDFDEPLPSHYQEFEQQKYQGYAFGLILSAGDEYSLEWNSKPAIKHDAMSHGLQCISKLVGSPSEWMIESSSIQWIWTHK